MYIIFSYVIFKIIKKIRRKKYMGSSIIPDEKTVKGIKNVLIIICITLTILIGLIIIVIL